MHITKEQKEILESRAIGKSVLNEMSTVRTMIFPENDLCAYEKINADVLKSMHNKIVDVFVNFNYTKHIGIGLLVYVDNVGLEAIIMVDKGYVYLTDAYFKNASLGFRQCNDSRDFVPESISIGF